MGALSCVIAGGAIRMVRDVPAGEELCALLGGSLALALAMALTLMLNVTPTLIQLLP